MALIGRTVNRADLLLSENNFEPIPANKYKAEIVKTDYTTTRKGGTMYKFWFQVIEGPYAKRQVIMNINDIVVPRTDLPEEEARKKAETAMRIGGDQLDQLFEATGMATVHDTDEFLHKVVEIEVTVTPAQGNYSASNDIKKVRKVEGMQNAAPVTAPGYGAPVGAPTMTPNVNPTMAPNMGYGMPNGQPMPSAPMGMGAVPAAPYQRPM